MLLVPDAYMMGQKLDTLTGPAVTLTRTGEDVKSWSPAQPPSIRFQSTPADAATVTLDKETAEGTARAWTFLFDRKKPVGTWLYVTADAKPSLSPGATIDPEDGLLRWRGYLAPKTFDLDNLRKKWIDAQVWPLGGAYGTVWNPVLAATIVEIEPLPAQWTVMGKSYAFSSNDGWGNPGFPVQGGLRIRLKLPTPGWNYSGSIGDQGPTWVPSTVGINEATLDVADEWHLGRLVTDRAPDLADSTPEMARAFGRREVVAGMTKGMVARILGYPRTDSDVVFQLKQTTWTYPGPAPFSYVVKFDEKGRVASAQMEGRLP